MSLSTKYNSQSVEDKWYQHWMEKGYFNAKVNPQKEPFTIVMPPPNVTGVLHMGHMLNNTIQDVLIRKARMEGKEALWVPGTDHASIATEAKVVRMLREKGIKKSDLTRDEFMEHSWEWKEKYGGIILDQLKKLGASCDWDRTAFTMDDEYYKAVIRVFVDLYKKGYIYRGWRMVNWDVEAQTTVSNEEVIYADKEETSKLYKVQYKIKDSDETLVIATQRPETIMGDTGIAINPKDDRFKHLIGKKAIVPFVNREIPIIGDDYVEIEFGTGCLKVTPAHDPNDYEIGQRHNLEVIDTINLDGTMNEKCGVPAYVGMERFAVRKQIIKDLDAAGILMGFEEFTTKIGRSERTNTVIEPKLSLQWFINMKDISKTAHQVVMDDEVELVPAKFKNTYNHWMENVRDWCISRQLWWGQRIPAYFYGTGDDDFVVAENIEEAITLAKEKSGNSNLTAADLNQDEDVLDTWASSWLFPMAVFDGFKDDCFDKETGKVIKGKNADLDYFYPTNVLVTAPEILFFWVARMIIAGYEYMDEKPFKHVYLTGIVRDKQRRKMSKSLGNSPDPLDLIKEFGADAIRTGMLFSSPAGNDLLYDEKLVEQGRNFANKIWNAFRLVKGWEVGGTATPTENAVAIQWFDSRFNETLAEIEDHFSKFRISDALMATYKLIWNDFCSWYLEMIKPAYGEPIDPATYEVTLNLFEKIMKILHPFMPFITEEIWSELRERAEGQDIIVSAWPVIGGTDEALTKQAEIVFELVSQIRNARSSKGLSPKESLDLFIKAKDNAAYERFDGMIKKLCNIGELQFTESKVDSALSFVIKSDEFYLPMPEGSIDVEAEKAEIEKELEYTKGFLNSVMKKLSNERFVNNAPEQVVASEKKKQADAESKIKVLEEKLASLN
ncbi:valine--tRNA ligase [Roseivirga pacifica]|uniref:valine--tRNA ligase n=1 Tax=Roseivirga pacifica TaxID=1267423 RepID=UPI002096269A|nr:valine--tRNA ligase [Roseivirga pacifica]MCO6358338.1 valine--tRNA ligase [Roseivirga pacifica]MCO6366198.1 valine--tRNA ligase [Roseivirga pacifica]MCO6369251.1 valine--tRNA ligase [Roseivirga pacifica]MCO6374069.1 valine--tRNA ligase [Roseivirga pacifica]MCO6378445.1 valine--tRNA ligase [Roseivirga pacifica]